MCLNDEHDWKYIDVSMEVCFICGLQKETNKYCLAEGSYEFRPIRFPPYRRICRFAPLCDTLPQEVRNVVLKMYFTILNRWKTYQKRRSNYFYNRGVMFSFLTSLHFEQPYHYVLQNRVSEEAQRKEMTFLLKADPNPFVPPKLTGLDAIWQLFELEKGSCGF